MCPGLLGRKLAVATLLFATTALGQDADTGEAEAAEDDSAPVVEQEQSEDVETITVTGSRLQEGDLRPSSIA